MQETTKDNKVFTTQRNSAFFFFFPWQQNPGIILHELFE